MLTKQDMKDVFEQDLIPALMKVFVTKDDLKEELKRAFEKQDQKIGNRFDRLEKRMDHIEETMDQRFAQVDERFAQVDQRFAQVDQRFDDANERMQEMQLTLNTVHQKLDQHIEDTSSKLTAHLRRIHELQGIPVSDKTRVGYTTSTVKPKKKK